MAKTLEKRLNEGQNLQKAINNLNQSYERRISRYDKRIGKMLEKEHIYFITFTLSDKYINLKENTIERKIKEALGSASSWIVNRDYGKKNNRLHYHSLVAYEQELIYKDLISIYRYGSIDIIPVKDKNQKALREYLLGHIEKQTASKVMVSRKRRV